MSNEQEKPKSFIQIIFSDVGSVVFSAQEDGVVPLQFLAIAEYFRIMGEVGIARQEREAQRNKIAVPGVSNEELLR